MTNTLAIDMTFRPDTYWPESRTIEQLLSRIKGKARRDLARGILQTQGFPALTTFIARENLNESMRQDWGKIHPLMMGGEYLPDLAPNEVELARISMASVTGDQVSIRTKPGENTISYSVVDENGMEFSLAFTESKLPLTLEELVTFINESTYKDDIWKGGLIVSHWNYQYDSEGDAQEAIDFISVESVWYPELADWYEIHGREWSAGK